MNICMSKLKNFQGSGIMCSNDHLQGSRFYPRASHLWFFRANKLKAENFNGRNVVTEGYEFTCFQLVRVATYSFTYI